MAQKSTNQSEEANVEETKVKELEAGGSHEVQAEAASGVVSHLVQAGSKPQKKPLKNFLKSKKGKITLAIIAGVFLLVGVLFAVPVTRYGIMGPFVRKDVVVRVVDSKTGKPVSDAEAILGSASGKTDKDGKLSLKAVPVGQYKLTVKKKLHKDGSADVTVPILSAAQVSDVKLEATGRQVPVTVKNKINGKPLSKVSIVAGESTAITDDKGEAVLVLPANEESAKATFKLEGYNDNAADITVSEQADAKNVFTLTPSGKIYFLSNRTGKVNIMKSNLDGTDQKVVLDATGNPEEMNITFVPSPDRRYIALIATRDANRKIYLIDGSSDKLTVIEDAGKPKYNPFSIVGWVDHHLIYKVTTDLARYVPGRVALRAFDASKNKLTTLDTTKGDGHAHEVVANIELLSDKVFFTKYWENDRQSIPPQKMTVNTVKFNGQDKREVHTFDQLWDSQFGASMQIKPGEVHFTVEVAIYNGTPRRSYFKYADNQVTLLNLPNNQFQASLNYQLSPSRQKALWSEMRDGNQVLFVGNSSLEKGKEIGRLKDFGLYGGGEWVTDDYLLFVKRNEIYIGSAESFAEGSLVKVTEFVGPYGY